MKRAEAPFHRVLRESLGAAHAEAYLVPLRSWTKPNSDCVYEKTEQLFRASCHILPTPHRNWHVSQIGPRGVLSRVRQLSRSKTGWGWHSRCEGHKLKIAVWAPIVAATQLLIAVAPCVAGPAAQTSETRTVPPALSARDAGARYGQALGAVEICIGSTVTGRGKALADSYSGGEIEDFKTQAAKVFDAWLKVKNCRNQRDPNQCKITMDNSCLAAEAEIGAAGTAVPGLVEFMKR